MKPFLLEVAEKVYQNHHRKLDGLTFVFPNRRASLYFRKHLSSLLDKPAFAPKLITIEDFIGGLSSLKVPDKLHLVHVLYTVYYQVLHSSQVNHQDEDATSQEPFDQFYFWGEMLLRDFDEVDKYLVSADHLFKDLSHLKELDVTFDFLTDEQKEFLRSFWINFDEKESVNKKKFLHIWRKLPDVYKNFRKELQSAGLAYEGMLHREVAENLKTLGQAELNDSNTSKPDHHGRLTFIGFNALTKAEEAIITHFVQKQAAEVYWDLDAYYTHNHTQEAGSFFRTYQQHAVLGKTFPPDIPSNFRSINTVNVFGAAQPVGQAKLMAQILQAKLQQGFLPEETLVVLPDEKLLMPVLHGISAGVETLNVTMGFSLSSTPVFNLIELLIELQISKKDNHFNHRSVLALLGHPYITAADAGVANSKRKEILQHNWIYIPQNFLGTTVSLHRDVFQAIYANQTQASIPGPSLLAYLKKILTEIGSLSSISAFDKEYCYHFIKLINRMQEVLHPYSTSTSDFSVEHPAKHPQGDVSIKTKQARDRQAFKSFLRLFRQITRSEKIPFLGEPLRGLQVMGVLETRNLDFKNVFILSLNEGVFPSFNSKGSYVPFTLRKAYVMPTVDHQDALYAYLFYRILQRAENVFLFYNSETDVLGQGEMSRYLQQLLFESGLPVEKHILHNTIQPLAITPIVVKKDERVFESLARHCKGQIQSKALTPSALNDYIECRLRFYFRYVARIREPREVEDELDARLLGNFLHKVMETFYVKLIQAKGTNRIEAGDLGNYETKIDSILDRIFIETYKLDPDKPVEYEGQRVVVKEVVKRFVDRIILLDKAYAPFTLEGLERKNLTYSLTLDTGGSPEIVLGGVIDRADRKENVVRVIDYKTGKDQLSFDDLPSLFSREGRRNKAAFQTMLYALLYKRSLPSSDLVRLIPGLLNRINLFEDDFIFGLRFGKEILRDATPLLPEFEQLLKKLLEELYDPDVPFDQTSDVEACQYCSYRGICYR